MNGRRVLLGIASAGSPTEPFLASLSRLRMPANAPTLERSVAFGNYIPAQRELIMDDAVAGNYDYLFFVDDDIILPEDALERLIETAEADPATAVVGALYYARDSIRPIVVADWDADDTSSAHIPAFSSDSTDPVDAIGFGCALLRVSVAREMTPPYFPAHVYIERQARRVRQCDEDYRYCHRVRAAGHRVRLDARVRCGHYDRGTNTTAPLRWETDSETDFPRMIVTIEGAARLVPIDPSVPSLHEQHVVADLTYISVDA